MTALDHATAADIRADRPTIRVLIVTAATAARMLQRNVHNRALDPVTVEKYRRDMEAGRWVYAADPIRFDVNGNLLDGQHRLAALAQCEDVSLPFLVVGGLRPETQQIMDGGKARQAGQQLQMLGYRNSNEIAAGVRLHIVVSDGLLFRDTNVARLITTAHIQQWVADNPGIIAHVQSLMAALKAPDAPPRIAMAAAIQFLNLDVEETYEFFGLLRDGPGGKGHPINTLDKTLRDWRRHGRRVENRDGLAMFFLAWNAWREGRDLTKFQRPRGSRWTAKTFPVPR